MPKERGFTRIASRPFFISFVLYSSSFFGSPRDSPKGSNHLPPGYLQATTPHTQECTFSHPTARFYDLIHAFSCRLHSLRIERDIHKQTERADPRKPYPLLWPLSSSVTPRKLPSPWLPGFFRSAHRLPSTHPISRICTNSIDAAQQTTPDSAPYFHVLICKVGLASYPSGKGYIELKA